MKIYKYYVIIYKNAEGKTTDTGEMLCENEQEALSLTTQFVRDNLIDIYLGPSNSKLVTQYPSPWKTK